MMPIPRRYSLLLDDMAYAVTDTAGYTARRRTKYLASKMDEKVREIAERERRNNACRVYWVEPGSLR